ncbi:MAG: V4R domain-containing protein [Longimicrobiales bacterium]
MQSTPREVSLPAEAFDHLRAALVREAGETAGVQALHAAGFSTGERVYDLFARADDTPGAGLGTGAFWSRVTSFFRDRGWGLLVHESRHPGVSVLSSADWAEAGAGDGDHSTCAFTSGVLSCVLTRAADAPGAVLETSCRARGDERCEFAFGSERTIHGLYEVLLEGCSLDEALARL